MLADTGRWVAKPVMARFAITALPQQAIGRSFGGLCQSLNQFAAQKRKITFHAASTANQYMVSPGCAIGEDKFTGQAAEPAFHPVADDGVANFLGNSDAKPDRGIAIVAVAHKQNEPGICESPRRIRREEITPFPDAG